MWCQRYLIAYLGLLKKPTSNKDPWQSISFTDAETEQNSVDILARSLVTSIVISYARPWSKNRNAGGKPTKLSNKIFKGMQEAGNLRETDEPLFPFNHDVHNRVLSARDKVVAHSDHGEWEMQIAVGTYGTTTSGRDPFAYLSGSKGQELLENTKSLRSFLSRQNVSS